MSKYFVTPLDLDDAHPDVIEASNIKDVCIKAIGMFGPQDVWSMKVTYDSDKAWICNFNNDLGWHYFSVWGGKVTKLFPDGGPRPPTYPRDDSFVSRKIGKPRAPRSGVYTMDDWNRDRTFSPRPGQEVSPEIYDEMQFAGTLRRIPTSVLDRYGCVRGYLTGHEFDDRNGPKYAAFGETADGRFLYLGLSKAVPYTFGDPPTWMDDYYHEPKKKGKAKSSNMKSENGNAERRSMWSVSRHLASTPGDEGLSGHHMNVAPTRGNGGRQPKDDGKKGNMASNAKKSKSNTQPRNKKGRFISREMAERPRKANGQFKRKSTGGRR